MTHDELLADINKEIEIAEFGERCGDGGWSIGAKALFAVVELHKPNGVFCGGCGEYYDACPTIQAIEAAIARGQK